MKFTCWNPDMGDEGPDDGEEIDTIGDVGFAAERYVENNFCRWEYPSECTVMIQDENGRTVSVNVTVEQVPAFHAGKPKEVQS